MFYNMGNSLTPFFIIYAIYIRFNSIIKLTDEYRYDIVKLRLEAESTFSKIVCQDIKMEDTIMKKCKIEEMFRLILAFLTLSLLFACSPTSAKTTDNTPDSELTERLLSAIDISKDDFLAAYFNDNNSISNNLEDVLLFKEMFLCDIDSDGKNEAIGFYQVLDTVHSAGEDRTLVIALDDDLNILAQKSFAADKTSYQWEENSDGKPMLRFTGLTTYQRFTSSRDEIWEYENNEWTIQN